MEARLERSSHLLSTITRHVGIAAAIPTSSQTLDHIELVHLEAQRVLMVVVTRDHMVRNKVVLLAEPVTQDELNSIRNYVNVNFGGWALPAIQTELRRRLEAESAAYDAILRLLSMLFRKGLLDIGSAPEVRLEGTFNLLGPDLSVHGERLRELFHALEEKKKILDLLEQFLGQTQGEIAFQVGLADAHPCMKGLALIGVTCMLPGLQARMAVLGPLRMNYEKAITAVRHVGEALQSAQT
jgi:heat-inducible transcriptional repressor